MQFFNIVVNIIFFKKLYFLNLVLVQVFKPELKTLSHKIALAPSKNKIARHMKIRGYRK